MTHPFSRFLSLYTPSIYELSLNSFLALQGGEGTPAWRRWPGRSQGTLVATCPLLRKALKASFPDLCLQCHLHALDFCSFLSHSLWNLYPCGLHTYYFTMQRQPAMPRKSQIQSLYLTSDTIYNSLFLFFLIFQLQCTVHIVLC